MYREFYTILNFWSEYNFELENLLIFMFEYILFMSGLSDKINVWKVDMKY